MIGVSLRSLELSPLTNNIGDGFSMLAMYDFTITRTFTTQVF